jgi:hypothetical protein
MERGLVNEVSVDISGWHGGALVSLLLYDELKENSRRKTKSNALPPVVTDKGEEVEAGLFCSSPIITLFFTDLGASTVTVGCFTVHCLHKRLYIFVYVQHGAFNRNEFWGLKAAGA